MAETVLFGRYELLEPAGSGGSAQVWRALDRETGDEVALKRLHPIVFADEAGRHRLEREFRSLRSLDEPHVVPVRDLHIEDDDAALVLDYVAGPSLARRLTDGPPIRADEAVSIASDVAAALAAAHAAGIVHRDVTPGNILLEPTDGARLTDFGIARGSADAATATLTADGELVGTLRYLAPEQLRGEPATPASDLHALAAVTYEMLAGQPAYPATTPVALAESHARGPARIRSVSRALDEAVRRGLAPNPADRQPDVRAFVDELVAALEDARTEAIDVAAFAPVAGAGPLGASAPAPLIAAAAASKVAFRGRPAGPLVALFALALSAVAVLALAPDPTGDAIGANPAASAQPSRVATPAATATTTPTPTPTPGPEDDAKGNGEGKGRGNDHGKGNEKDD